MTTTITIKTKGEDDVQDAIDKIEVSFEDLVGAADQVNTELDGQKKNYSELVEEMKKVERQSEKTFGKKGGGGAGGAGGDGIGMIGKIGLVTAGLWATIEAAKKVREFISSMAESGNEGMIRLNETLTRTEASFSHLAASFLDSDWANQTAENVGLLADAFHGLLRDMSISEVQTERDIQNRKQILGLVDAQLETTRRGRQLEAMGVEEARKKLAENREILLSKENQNLSEEEAQRLGQEILVLEAKITTERKNQLRVAEEEYRKRKEQFEQLERVRERISHAAIERDMQRRNAERDAYRKQIEDEKKDREELAKKQLQWDMQRRALESHFEAQRAEAHKKRMNEIMEERRAKFQKETAAFQGEQGPAQQLLGQQGVGDVIQRMIRNLTEQAIAKAEQEAGRELSKREQSTIGRNVQRDVNRDFQRFQQGPGRGQTPADFAKFQEEFSAEAKKAYEQNAAATINSLRKSGKITDEQTAVLKEATKKLIDQQDEQMRQAREIENVKRELSALNGNKRRTSPNGAGVR
jgi:hypothetical protein